MATRTAKDAFQDEIEKWVESRVANYKHLRGGEQVLCWPVAPSHINRRSFSDRYDTKKASPGLTRMPRGILHLNVYLIARLGRY